jgi:hypothetical protein
VFVARKTLLGRSEEEYPVALPDALPTVGLPLWGERPDLPLDLAAAFRAACDLTTGGRPIDYFTETVPEPALTPEEATWVRNRLEPAQ